MKEEDTAPILAQGQGLIQGPALALGLGLQGVLAEEMTPEKDIRLREDEGTKSQTPALLEVLNMNLNDRPYYPACLSVFICSLRHSRYNS